MIRLFKRLRLAWLLERARRFSYICIDDSGCCAILNKKWQVVSFIQSKELAIKAVDYLNLIQYLKLGLIPLTAEMIANEPDAERRQELIKACLLREKDPT